MHEVRVVSAANDCRVSVPEGSVGEWSVSQFEITKDTPDALYYAIHGRPIPPGTYTRLTRGGTGRGNVIMSDTPAEVRDHFEILYKLRLAEPETHVLIHGLGLGMVLGAALRNPNVAHVDVVEIAAEVIALVAPTYSSDPRLTIHEGDAFTYRWSTWKRWDIVWHDIWPNLCTDNLGEMATLHRKFGRRCDWQGSWGKESLRAERRRGS
jgi:hypothetical protein